MSYTPTFKSFKAHALAGVASLAITGGSAFAQGANAIEFDIDAQELGNALTEFGVQSRTEVLFNGSEVRGMTTDGVEGAFSAEQAIEILLDDTGIEYRQNEDGTLLVGTTLIAQASSLGEGSPQARPFRVAQLDQEDDIRGVGARDEDERRVEDTIVVTGTSISGAYPNAAPVEVLTSTEIEALGVVSVEDLFTRIPQNLNDTNRTAPFAVQGGTGASNSVNLRGVGAGATLILVNGRRVSSLGGLGPDISMLPLAAVDRVEVLTDGASAVYGSDAVGGVVNIILKDDQEGAETSLSYGTVTEGSHSRFQAEQSIGFDWQSGNLLAGYNFIDQTDLDASDRDFSSSASSPFALIP
ncbi:MAG: TonB-dependent receptor, partial [Pseudomonadota bacterium]